MKPTVEAFLRLLAWRPQRALAVAYWYVTRRKVRASNRLRDAVACAPFAYDILIREQAASDSAACDSVLSWRDRPAFSILAVATLDGGSIWAIDAIESAIRQSYDRWELLLISSCPLPPGYADDPRIRVFMPRSGYETTSLTLAIAEARGHLLVPLGEGVQLPAGALLRFAEALRDTPQARLLYGDEDTIGARRHRSRPWLKPRWNAEMVLALDFVSRACAVDAASARLAVKSGIYAADASAYGLMLAVTDDEAVPVVHVPHIVAHVAPGSQTGGQDARVRAVAACVAPAGALAEPGPFETVTVRWPLPDPLPAVTILIPTRDKADLVRACVDGLLAKTLYANYAVVIIDNGSVEPASLDYFTQISRDPRVTILPCDLPYNFSAINNYAVKKTQSDYLCFLNNDTEILDGDWLGEMMRYAVKPEVGAVGAQLLYEDRSIQHAGVVIGLGNAAGHAHRALAQGDSGYFAQAYAAHYASAVTAACMVVERRKFLAVGGFDAEHLQIAYNDVDLCLKLGRAGWRNVYAPQAKLLHLETKSRGADLSPTHVERYMCELAVLQKRWDTTTVVDPMHHPGLDRGSETYRISF